MRLIVGLDVEMLVWMVVRGDDGVNLERQRKREREGEKGEFRIFVRNEKGSFS